jgi:DNA-directed RNA polymerase subunit M/transcription elongation factor TFIIS
MCRVRADADGLRTSLPHLKDSAMSCPACTSTRLTSIQIRLAPEEDHTFASCQACEWKGWFKEGADVPLGKVLSLASERRF